MLSCRFAFAAQDQCERPWWFRRDLNGKRSVGHWTIWLKNVGRSMTRSLSARITRRGIVPHSIRWSLIFPGSSNTALISSVWTPDAARFIWTSSSSTPLSWCSFAALLWQHKTNGNISGERCLQELDELNTNQPLWMQKSEDVTNEEHVFFCKSLLLQGPLQLGEESRESWKMWANSRRWRVAAVVSCFRTGSCLMDVC